MTISVAKFLLKQALKGKRNLKLKSIYDINDGNFIIIQLLDKNTDSLIKEEKSTDSKYLLTFNLISEKIKRENLNIQFIHFCFFLDNDDNLVINVKTFDADNKLIYEENL